MNDEEETEIRADKLRVAREGIERSSGRLETTCRRQRKYFRDPAENSPKPDFVQADRNLLPPSSPPSASGTAMRQQRIHRRETERLPGEPATARCGGPRRQPARHSCVGAARCGWRRLRGAPLARFAAAVGPPGFDRPVARPPNGTSITAHFHVIQENRTSTVSLRGRR